MDDSARIVSFVPHWLQIWYAVNLPILITEWMFIKLRPRSLKGGDLAFLFPIFNYYVAKDTLFANYRDKVVNYIYNLGFIDIIAVIILYLNFNSHSHSPTFALLCVSREVFVATKTMIYIMYSTEYIVPSWRLFLTVLNGQWVLIPIMAVISINSLFLNAFVTKGVAL